MTLTTLTLLNIFTTFMFIQCNHPLSMTLIIILQTLLICTFTGMISQSFWFSYILFLVFLGGMLVLFIYITSLASNEMFSIPTTTIFSCMIIMMFIILLSWSLDSTFPTLITNNLDMNSTNLTSTNYWTETTLPLIKLYNNPTNLNTLMLMLYLFLTLIAIVKITNIFHGPLRSMH
uniref:NADH-ubiquinone oxidoreductase chain 6 n=1 Tax=Homogryllacris anelytra TaxID=1945531 RepID=A0A1X8VFY2_9ORTH|nr:NADH dehydrogenase subunit 6 [Homogryllacris anelytra]AQM40158.1 NADH dehydrogenase subunit 6 [Homogryllacris anelytra]